MDTRERVIQVARADAGRYVAECGGPIDLDGTDWDARAWAEARRSLGLDDERAAEFWATYRSELVIETERLCKPGG